jgi:hypothetical protein
MEILSNDILNDILELPPRTWIHPKIEDPRELRPEWNHPSRRMDVHHAWGGARKSIVFRGDPLFFFVVSSEVERD